MGEWLFRTPLRSGLFMLVTGVIFTAVAIGIGIETGWDLDAEIGYRSSPAWFMIPGGLVLGVGSTIVGIATLVLRARPSADDRQPPPEER